VLTSVVGKTCKQAVAHGRLVVGAIEIDLLFVPRSFLIPVGVSGGVENIKNRQVLNSLVGLTGLEQDQTVMSGL